MLTLDDFLQAIAADPTGGQDTWRVLADWLEDQGDPRYELVRLRYQPGYRCDLPLRQREERVRELLDRVPPLFENPLNVHFAWVPPGTFWMGGGGGEPGKKQVTIEQGFALGVFPVTQGQWQAVMGDTPSWFSRTGLGRNNIVDISDEELKLFPVESVSWNEVREFLQKLNEKECNGGWLYRLASEAEWEYSCRGGATSKEECSYHFYLDKPTNDLSSLQANFDGEYPYCLIEVGPNLKRTTKVGSYVPNRFGLYDMHGNVWEWCPDYSDKGRTFRVFRGGGWRNSRKECRAFYRGTDGGDSRFFDVGFRLARSSVLAQARESNVNSV